MFIHRWHDAVRSVCVDEDSRVEVDEFRHALVAQAETRSHLRKLARYPLLCACCAALNRGRRSTPTREPSADTAAGDPLPRDLTAALAPGTAGGAAQPPAATLKVPIVSFPKGVPAVAPRLHHRPVNPTLRKSASWLGLRSNHWWS